MTLSKPELNFIKSRILNKRWDSGSMNTERRRNFLNRCVERGVIDRNGNPTDRAITAYHNQM